LDGWRQAKLTIPHGITRDARKIVRAYERNLARENIPVGRGSAPALTIRDLRRIVEACPPTLEGIRDRTIIVIGFGIAARRSELATLLAATSHETPAVASSPSGTAKPAVGNPSSHPAPKPKPAR
jgi:hypothetical protein